MSTCVGNSSGEDVPCIGVKLMRTFGEMEMRLRQSALTLQRRGIAIRSCDYRSNTESKV
jgi:hypothetical protein